MERHPLSQVNARRGAAALGAVRAALGVVAFIAPDRVVEPWVGPVVDPDKRAVLARALGGRDVALGLGALAALRGRSSLRSWVIAGGLADAGDLTATLMGLRRLPWTGRVGVVAITAAAVAGAAVVAVGLGPES
jgi:hypothetical protein